MINSIDDLERVLKLAANTKGLATLKVGEVFLQFDKGADLSSGIEGLMRQIKAGDKKQPAVSGPNWEEDPDWYQDGVDPGPDAAESYLKANGGKAPPPEYVEASEPPEGDE